MSCRSFDSNFTRPGFYKCLVLLHVAKIFVPVQIFWFSPKIWLHLVPLQKLLCLHKKQIYWMQIIFLSGTKCLWLPQNVNKFLVWHKNIWTSQNILGPVKGTRHSFVIYSKICKPWSWPIRQSDLVISFSSKNLIKIIY